MPEMAAELPPAGESRDNLTAMSLLDQVIAWGGALKTLRGNK